MSIEIQSELHTNYVHIRCRGVRSSYALLGVYDSAFQIADSEELPAVLVDIRDLTGSPPTVMERYDQGVHVADLQCTRYRDIAFVLVGNVPMIDPGDFGETVARNRGGSGRAFTDIDEAVDWIKKRGPTNSGAR